MINEDCDDLHVENFIELANLPSDTNQVKEIFQSIAISPIPLSRPLPQDLVGIRDQLELPRNGRRNRARRDVW